MLILSLSEKLRRIYSFFRRLSHGVLLHLCEFSRCGFWMPFSISAAIGFIAFERRAVLDGLVMISCFNQLREEGKACETLCIKGRCWGCDRSL